MDKAEIKKKIAELEAELDKVSNKSDIAIKMAPARAGAMKVLEKGDMAMKKNMVLQKLKKKKNK